MAVRNARRATRRHRPDPDSVESWERFLAKFARNFMYTPMGGVTLGAPGRAIKEYAEFLAERYPQGAPKGGEK